MSVELSTIILFVLMLLLLATGLPVVFSLGILAIVFSYLTVGEGVLIMLPRTINSVSALYILLAGPLFVFMAGVLQNSGIAEALFKTMRFWMGPLNGGLAMGVVVICTIMAAMTGGTGAGTLTMGTIALPILKRLKYNDHLAIGCVAAGGVLGILIPPSIIMIIYASVSGESVGKLFAGGLFPGLLLSSLYIIYIGIRCFLNPALGPPLPAEEHGTLKEKIVSLKGVILPILLIVLVLGVIYGGIATPTEAAGVGALGSVICAAFNRRLTWRVIRESCLMSFRLICMALWILSVAVYFNQTFQLMGGADLVQRTAMALPLGRWGVLVCFMFLLFLLGMMMDDFAVVMLAAPIFIPVVEALGFDLLWFALLFMLNMQMAYLTPPYGFNLFYMRALVPKEVSMGVIYKSMVPFIGLQAIAVAICMKFPAICIWLPGVLFD